MVSVWEVAQTEAHRYPPLDQAIEVDAAIIGGGVTGLATALRLAEAGRKVAVLEAHRVGQGNTGGSTGNLYATLSEGLQPIRSKWSEDVVRELVHARTQALDLVENTIERYGIDCQFARRPLYRGIVQPDPEKQRRLEDEYRVASAAGLQVSLVDAVPELPFAIHRALKLENQAQHNPLRYALGLAEAIRGLGGLIHEGSQVVDVDNYRGIAKTERGQVTAAHLVHATHTPKGIHPVQAEMEPYREYGITARLQDTPYPEGVFWVLDGFHSLRSYHYQGQDYLVVVGEKHQTGHGKLGAGYYDRLEDYARSHFSVARVEHRWSAQQFKPADRLPYIGRSPLAKKAYLGTGYAADGLIWGEVAATVICAQILGREDRWGELFDPGRFTPGKSAKQWWQQNKMVVEHLVKGHLKPTQHKSLEQVAPGEGRVVNVDGEKLAVYRDEQGTLSAVSPVCPHMKCLVHWNAADSSWDCPCHGSRFQVDGRVIEGPALRGLARRTP